MAVPAPDTTATGLADEPDPLSAAWRRSYFGLGVAGVFSVFCNLLKLATPLYVLQVLDRVMASRSLETLVMLSIIVLIAIAVGILLEVYRRKMFIHWGTWIEQTFGPRLFAAGMHSKRQKSSPSTALRDLSTLRSFVSGSALTAWLDIVWAPVFIFVIYLISPPIALIVIAACGMALVLGAINDVTTRESRDSVFEARKDDREWVAAAERNRESLGSLSMVTNVSQRWFRSASDRLEGGAKNQNANVHLAAWLRFGGRVLRISAIGYGVWLVIQQQLTLGAVIAAGVLGRQAYSLVRTAMLKKRELKTAQRAYERFKKALRHSTPSYVSTSKTLVPVDLVFDNVSYRYPDQPRSLLRNLNMRIKPGEVTVIVGLSASGKTTLSRLASGLLEPRSGKILLGEVDVHRLQQNSTVREIGVLPQAYSLFAGTVRENIARLAEGDIGEVIRAAKLAGIHDVIVHLPEGYDTQISEQEPLLSSGQRKALAVARAFYGSPPVAVLDEPLPHLDRHARSAVVKGIRELKDNGTIVLITTQTRSLTRIADKVLVLRDNRWELLESPDDIAKLRRRRRRKSAPAKTDPASEPPVADEHDGGTES